MLGSTGATGGAGRSAGAGRVSLAGEAVGRFSAADGAVVGSGVAVDTGSGRRSVDSGAGGTGIDRAGSAASVNTGAFVAVMCFTTCW